MSFIKKIELRYNDSDQMGVVYHANYFVFFEQSRTAMLKEFGVDYYEVEEKGFIFPVRDVACTYFKSIRLGEEIVCEIWLRKMSKVKMEFEHEIRNVQGEVKAKGMSSIISVKKSDFKICKMDKNLPDVYKLKDKIERTF